MKSPIKIDSVFLEFRGVEVLRGVHLTFKADSITGLLGRNGCGKSCLLKVITGQITPQSKHIKYNDEVHINLFKEKGLINYLPQHEFHPKSITLRNLLWFYEIDEEIFIKEYPFFYGRVHDKFSIFSGGERRMIEVLLVLESSSKFSILDEPFSHIMPKHINLIKDRIKKISSQKGILITDHQYQNVVEISDDLYLLKDGCLREINNVEDLQTHGYIR